MEIFFSASSPEPMRVDGRRESYAHIPMPRMTNTYMLNGEDTLEQMIASVDDGLYAVNFDGGQVDITSGKFVFSANEAYLIKNGKISHPVKGHSRHRDMCVRLASSITCWLNTH
jgi:predicted Zn-dependent protease